MGFLKKGRVPDELPDLALNDSNVNSQPKLTEAPKPIAEATKPVIEQPKPIAETTKTEIKLTGESKKEVAGEDYLEFGESHGKPDDAEHIKSQIAKQISGDDIELSGFFDKVLEDVNGEIQDLGKLEDWYKNKFSNQDVVSGMKGYWEDNKSNIIIKNFGSEYKLKINEKIRELQELEADWREIYFKLIKKEEDMKMIEKELKDILSEFVELCKRRNIGKINSGKEEEFKEEKKDSKK